MQTIAIAQHGPLSVWLAQNQGTQRVKGVSILAIMACSQMRHSGSHAYHANSLAMQDSR